MNDWDAPSGLGSRRGGFVCNVLVTAEISGGITASWSSLYEMNKPLNTLGIKGFMWYTFTGSNRGHPD